MAQVSPIPLPDVAQSGAPINVTPPPEAFGAGVAGAGLGELGKVTDTTSDMLAKHATQFQAINNSMAANGASNAAAGAIDKMGADYRTANEGAAMYQNLPQFYKDLEAKRQSFMQGLSPQAQVEFDQQSRFYMNRTISQVTNDAATARKQQFLKTGDDTANLAVQTFATNPTPENEAHLHQVLGVLGYGLTLPGGANFTDAQLKTWIQSKLSPAYAAQVESAYRAGDIAQANQLLEQHKGDMTLDDFNKVSGGLRVANHANIVQGTADALVLGGSPKVLGQPTVPGSQDSEAIWTAMKTQESSNRPGIVNTATGVQGLTQMKPATAEEMANKLGIPWQPALMTAKTPEGAAYQEKLGHAYWEQALQVEGGDVNRALMYYYGGPNEQEWGPNTHAYVGQVMAHMPGGAQAPGQASGQPLSFSPMVFDPKEDPALTFAEADASMMRRAAAVAPGPNNAVLRQQIYEAGMQRIKSQIGLIDSSQKAVYDQIDNQVISGNIGSVAQLQAINPTAWAALPAKYKAALESQVRYQGNMVTEARQDNEALLAGRFAAADTNPADFMNTDIRAMDLTQSARQKYLDIQSKFASGALKPDALVARIERTDQFKSTFMSVTPPGEDAATQKTHYMQFIGAFSTEVADWRKGHPTGDPQPQDISRMLADITARHGANWFSKGTPAFEYPKSEEQSLIDKAHQYGQPADPRTLGMIYMHQQHLNQQRVGSNAGR